MPALEDMKYPVNATGGGDKELPRIRFSYRKVKMGLPSLPLSLISHCKTFVCSYVISLMKTFCLLVLLVHGTIPTSKPVPDGKCLRETSSFGLQIELQGHALRQRVSTGSGHNSDA